MFNLQDNVPSIVSPSISELAIAPSRPRYLVFCAGLDRTFVHRIRNAYQTSYSQSSSLLASPGVGYDVRIIGFYSQDAECLFKHVNLVPNLLILGSGFKAPYSKVVKKWLNDKHPSVMRVDEAETDPTRLPHDEYYLRTYTVMPYGETSNTWRVTNEIDYGILVNLNWRREIKIEDFDHHTIKIDDFDSESSSDALSSYDMVAAARETSFFLRPDIQVSITSLSAVANFFGLSEH
jgi:hypothetical protein